jgi:uncharacterized glyoxalase superfamily protein PhnB
MLANRSIPKCTVIPELAYADVEQAAAWLCEAFGFTLRIGMGSHRAQLNVGDGAVVLTEKTRGEWTSSMLVRVEDVDAHCARAKKYGAKILKAAADYPYGERQYSVEDLAGQRWTFTQSIADVTPEEWGGKSGEI